MLAERRSLSCSFVYLKGSKIFFGILKFVSKMSDCIKFQKHVPLNYIVSLRIRLFYFVYCKDYQWSNQVSLNPVVSLTRLTIRKMMQFGTTTVKKRKMQKTLLTTRLKAKVNNEHSLP